MYVAFILHADKVRDTHILLLEVPIMLCSVHQANYAHQFEPIMLINLVFCRLICDSSLGNSLFIASFVLTIHISVLKLQLH